MDEIMPCTRRPSSATASTPAAPPPPSPAVEIIILLTAVASDGRDLLLPRQRVGAQKQARPRPRSMRVAAGARVAEALLRTTAGSMLVLPPLRRPSKRDSRPNPLVGEPCELTLKRRLSIVRCTHGGACCS